MIFYRYDYFGDVFGDIASAQLHGGDTCGAGSIPAAYFSLDGLLVPWNWHYLAPTTSKSSVKSGHC